MKKIKLVLATLTSSVLTLALVVHQPTEATVPGNNQVMNINTSGGQSTPITGSDVSADGRFIAFTSNANDLVSSDTNNKNDIFVRDRTTSTTTRVSVSSAGVEADNQSLSPKISYDGRYVVFESEATNLTSTTISGTFKHVYRHDRQTGVTDLVSALAPISTSDDFNQMADINSDGRFVVFQSTDKSLIGSSGNMPGHIVVKDMVTGTIKLVSTDPSGVSTIGFQASNPSISCDGGIIAFQSSSYDTSLNTRRDIIMNVRAGGEHITNITKDGDHHSGSPSISCDGNHIAFQTRATNLIPGGTSANSSEIVLAYNHVDKSTRLISKKSNGSVVRIGTYDGIHIFKPSISGDGRFITYASYANPISDSSNRGQIYIVDTINDTTERVSRGPSATYGDWHSQDATISSNGKYAIFYSGANNLIASDTNPADDVFIAETGF